MQNLIALDDRKIRQKAFSQLERLLKKLQRMESHVETFYEHDERQFQNWYELTFRAQHQAMADLRAEYRELADFHNGMLALAHLEGLSLPEAAWRLREEERVYREGSEAERARIEELRILREQFIRGESERTAARGGKRRRADKEPGRAHAPPDASDLEELNEIQSLSDAELEEWCASGEMAFALLGMTLKAASFTSDFTLFFRLWDLTHQKIQRDFARDFQREQGCSLFDVIEAVRQNVGAEARARAEEATETNREAAAKAEGLKLLFRQLARKLHPDMNVADQGADVAANIDWRKKMWLRVQEAYKAKDSRLLNKLFHLVLLRGRELNDLRLSELRLSEEWLNDEIQETAEYIRNLRRNLAWGFSRRKDFGPIKRRIDRDMLKTRRELEAQVIELRTHHAFLERLGRESTRR